MDTLLQRMNAKAAVCGVFCKTKDPAFIEIIGKSGFDFAILDCEHGPTSTETLYPLILAAQAAHLLPVVRVGSLSAVEIQRALDLGIAGVQIPQVETADDARKAVEYTRFHPLGRRGVCRFVRAAEYSLMPKERYFAAQNESVAVIIHIEGMRGVENIENITAVDGIDIIFIGPYDLSQSLGIPGHTEHPSVQKAVADIAARCRAKGKQAGIFVESAEAAARYRAMGIHYIAYSVDVGIFANACRAIADSLKAPAARSRRLGKKR